MTALIEALLRQLAENIDGQYGQDFLQSWDKNDRALHATLLTIKILKKLYAANIAPRIYETGTAISIFKDQSTRTRYSFDSASNLLGLNPIELDLGKSQVAHGETNLETANMISFLTRIIGIRDDIYIGVGHNYMLEMANAVEKGYQEGVLYHRPSLINLQSDTDHPTQSMADLMHLVEHFGGVEKLRGKKMAMSWAYSPSYGKPLSVPQGVIGLFARFGMHISLAYPKGYDLMPGTIERVKGFADGSGGSLTVTNTMSEAFDNADIVYPKSWASFAIMQQRTELLSSGNKNAYEDLEAAALAENAKHTDWECSEELMGKTKNGSALYMHCLPAEISGVSVIKGKPCKVGEVAESVFSRYRAPLYLQASNKPFAIAAMAILTQCNDPVSVLRKVFARKLPLKLD